MDNIFTFDIEEENIEENTQPTQQKFQKDSQMSEQSSVLNLPNTSSPFIFEDFSQFEEEKLVQRKFQRRRMRLPGGKEKENKSKDTQNYIEKKTEKEQKNSQQEVHEKENTKNEIKTKIMPGLQFQDLGANEMQYVSDKKALKVTDIRRFLHTPLGDYKVKAIIKKEGGNFFSLNTKFYISIEQNNRYLFSVTRQGLTEYIFSLDKNNVSEKKKSYLGKLCSNMTGTQFLLFDNGFSPKETRSLQCCRKQLASIKYSTITGPRKFTTIVSKNNQGFYAVDPQQNILEQKWQKKQRDFLSILYSKAPEYDPEDGNYKLDFKGVVKKASVKNFILGGKQWDDSLIFGKIDNQTFMMEIKEPLSVMQAAAICISSIHYKLQWR